MKTPTINSRVVKLEVLKGTATRASVNAVESRTTSLESDVATVQSDISTLQGDVATLTQGIQDAVSTHNTAGDSHADIRTLVADLMSNVEEVDADFVSISYNPSGGAAGGGGLSVSTSDPPPLSSVTLTWSTNGDANGAMYYLGSLGGSWVNPHAGGQVTVVRSASYSIAAQNFVNRDTEYGYGSGLGCFVGIDLGAGRSIRPNVYTLRNYTNADRYLRNWVFEGTNTVEANTEAAWNDATWTALDTRSNDTTMTSPAIWKYELTQPETAYRYVRWRLTGNDSLGDPYLALTEFELYGVLNGTFAAVLPSWARGWLSDGTYYLPGVW